MRFFELLHGFAFLEDGSKGDAAEVWFQGFEKAWLQHQWRCEGEKNSLISVIILGFRWRESSKFCCGPFGFLPHGSIPGPSCSPYLIFQDIFNSIAVSLDLIFSFNNPDLIMRFSMAEIQN